MAIPVIYGHLGERRCKAEAFSVRRLRIGEVQLRVSSGWMRTLEEMSWFMGCTDGKGGNAA